MKVDIDAIDQADRMGFSVNFIVGDNGSGKSTALRQLAMESIRRGSSVVAICNTIYDRFIGLGQCERISNNAGRGLPAAILKRAITAALKDGPSRLGHLGDILEYCGYSADFGISIRWNSSFGGDAVVALSQVQPSLNKEETSEIAQAISLAQRRHSTDETLWFRFSSIGFEALLDEAVVRLVKWEQALRRAKILKSIEIFLKKADDKAVPLRQASSGELTLIATTVFLSIVATRNAVVLIDEPENSLHPHWQREYVQRLADILYFQQPTFYIATHAPIIVSGAFANAKLKTRVFCVSDQQLSGISHKDRGVEAMLWSVFRTVTPANHFISRLLAEAVAEAGSGKKTLEEVRRLIQTMREQAYDRAQDEFFDAVTALAEKVVAEAQIAGGGGPDNA